MPFESPSEPTSEAAGGQQQHLAIDVCPVADVARRLSKISGRLEELGRREPTTEQAGRAQHDEEAELFDLRRSLINDLEWITPTSAEGALLTVLALHEVSVLDPSELGRERQLRKIARLHSRLLEWFSASADAPLERALLDTFPDTQLATAFRDRWAT